MRNILACVDFSDVTQRLVDQATELATATGASLTLLHVVMPEEVYPVYDATAVAVQSDLQRAIQRSETTLRPWLERASAAGLAVGAEVREGRAVEVILREAERNHADLIVIGSHGHGTIHHVIFGSVAEGVIRKATVPVLIVPSRLPSA